MDTSPLGKGNLFHTPGLSLPPYVRAVVRGIRKSNPSLSLSEAIQRAIGVIRNWSEGKGNVTPATRAKALAAIAWWEKAKAQARATPNKGGR